MTSQAKFPFDSNSSGWKANNAEVSLTLLFIALLVWWVGDRSRVGFCLSMAQALIATVTLQMLSSYGVLEYKDADFAGVRSWLPALLFAGCACVGTLGRQLSKTDDR